MWTKPDLREAEKKSEDIYEKLPLFEIEDLYGKTEAGKILGKTYKRFNLNPSCQIARKIAHSILGLGHLWNG